jgi:antitoxin component YwqK of YwqJK toxin-antitoxin module
MIKLLHNTGLFAIILGFCLFSCENKETLRKYYDNGSIKAEVEVVNGQKNGKHIEYFENGDTLSISEWRDGKLNGLRLDFFSKGKIRSVSFWKNNEVNGINKSYFENGNLESISIWENGLENGEGKFFYKNGSIKHFYNRRQGGLNGPYKWYYENGNVEEEGFYRDGIKVGIVKEYFETGELLAANRFVNLKGEQKPMGGVEYNRDGSIMHETIRVNLKPNKDTLKLGEKLDLTIELKKPYFGNTKIIFGDFDYKFDEVDKSSLDTLFAVNHEATYSVKPISRGENWIRGIANNYEVLDEKENITKESHVYFEFFYYVE